ncbi:YHS domain-containing protein [Candidatus Woesebacteria bacterium]|nr:YHS domain-containing protein [Candidatus Woesebacteria bacterium]
MKKVLGAILILVVLSLNCIAAEYNVPARQVIGYCPVKTAHAKGVHNERTYYFCCEGCKAKFMQDPEKYLRN